MSVAVFNEGYTEEFGLEREQLTCNSRAAIKLFKCIANRQYLNCRQCVEHVRVVTNMSTKST